MKNMIVTGGAGFIGSNYIHYMLNKYPDLFIHNIDKMSYAASLGNLHGVDPTRYKLLQIDIGWDWNVQTMRSLIEETKPEWFVHFAAETHVDNSIANQDPFIKSNILGTIHVLEALKQSGNKTKLLHMSTDEIYGSLPITTDTDLLYAFMEHDPINPSSPYAASKVASEAFVIAYGRTWNVPYIIVNSANAYGPRQHPEKFIPKVITNALKDQPVPLYGTGVNERQWTYVEDVCSAVDVILTTGMLGDRYNIGASDHDMNNLQIAEFILTKLGRSKSLIQLVKDRLGHDLKYRVDTFKLEELGWHQETYLNEGLDKTIAWYLVK